jgi:hypothetical protein
MRSRPPLPYDWPDPGRQSAPDHRIVAGDAFDRVIEEAILRRPHWAYRVLHEAGHFRQTVNSAVHLHHRRPPPVPRQVPNLFHAAPIS